MKSIKLHPPPFICVFHSATRKSVFHNNIFSQCYAIYRGATEILKKSPCQKYKTKQACWHFDWSFFIVLFPLHHHGQSWPCYFVWRLHFSECDLQPRSSFHLILIWFFLHSRHVGAMHRAVKNQIQIYAQWNTSHISFRCQILLSTIQITN